MLLGAGKGFVAANRRERGVGVRTARRPGVAALVANRTRTAVEVPPGASKHGLASADPGGGRAAEQQNGRTAQQAPSSTQTTAQRNNEEGAEPRYDIEGKSEGEGEGQGTKGANAKADANAEADGGCGC